MNRLSNRFSNRLSHQVSKWIPSRPKSLSLSAITPAAVALGVMLISAACGTSSSSSSSTTEMRVVHLAPQEQQPLEMLIDNKSVFAALNYGVPSAFTTVTAINHDVKLNLSGTNLFDSPTEPFVKGTSYTYLITNSQSAGVNLQGNKIADDHTVADKGMFKIRVVNASPNVGSVDVYIVTPSTPPVKPTVAGLASNAASAYQSLASGAYYIYITPAGDQTCLTTIPPSCLVNLDGRNTTAGPTAVPAFQAGQNRTLIMLNQVPQVAGGGLYTTLPMLADLN